MRVNEVFYSIQGEGRYAGTPSVFVRTQGCNLKCPYCDTSYAQMPAFGGDKKVEDVLLQIIEVACRHICITGGEPLTQKEEVGILVRYLKRFFYNITIETNGTIQPPDWSNLVDSWSIDVKCPSAQPQVEHKIIWLSSRPCDQLKFVVSNEEDLEFAGDVILKTPRDGPEIYVSPMIADADDPLKSREWLIKVAEFCKEVNVRYSLQIHKMLWGSKKGV